MSISDPEEDILEDLDMEIEEEEEPTDNIAEFGAYRDIGAEGRLGGVIDEDVEINIIEGAKNQKLDPKSIFTLQLKEDLALLADRLRLSDSDIKILKQGVHRLYFIRLKNALAYILGYYLHIHQNNKIHLNVIKSLLANEWRDDKHVTLYECLKYGRYWSTQI